MYLLYIFRQASRTSWLATSNVRGPVVQWTTRLTMNQKIAGPSPARIYRVLCGKDLDRLEWQADQLQLMSEVLWCKGQCVWLQIRRLQVWVLPGSIGFYVARIYRQASMASWPATTDVRGPVAQWTMCQTTNQKIAGSSPARINRVLCGKDLDRLVWQAYVGTFKSKLC
jgi:hypothetical protein